jgi:hypothetical protein
MKAVISIRFSQCYRRRPGQIKRAINYSVTVEEKMLMVQEGME